MARRPRERPLWIPYASRRDSISIPDGRATHSGRMNAESWFALLIAAGVAGYLVYALLRPERF